MYRYPEIMNFRASPGTINALHAIAEAEGKRVSTIVREAVEQRLQASTTSTDLKAA